MARDGSTREVTPAEVQSALERSGYLFEQQVGNRLQDLGFVVHTNVAFEDPDEGKSREFDVNGELYLLDNRRDGSGLSLSMELIIECKANNFPLTLISRRSPSPYDVDGPVSVILPVTRVQKVLRQTGNETISRTTSTFRHLGLDKVHHFYRRDRKAVQFCRLLLQDKQWRAEHAGLFDSMILPLFKAFNCHRERVTNIKDRRFIHVIYPMIVCRGQLFDFDTSSSEAVPAEIPWGGLLRDLSSESLSGLHWVDFVQETHLESYVKECVLPFGEHLKQMILSTPDVFFRKDVPASESLVPGIADEV